MQIIEGDHGDRRCKFNFQREESKVVSESGPNFHGFKYHEPQALENASSSQSPSLWKNVGPGPAGPVDLTSLLSAFATAAKSESPGLLVTLVSRPPYLKFSSISSEDYIY